MWRKEGRQVKSMKSKCQQEWADLRYSEIHGSGMCEKGKVHRLKNWVYIHTDKPQIQEIHSLFNNQAVPGIPTEDTQSPSFHKKSFKGGFTFHSYLLDELIHIQRTCWSSTQVPRANRRAWKQAWHFNSLLWVVNFMGYCNRYSMFQLTRKLPISYL